MTEALRIWRRLLQDDAGQDAAEYAILTALAAMAALVAWQLVVAAINQAFVSSNSNVQGLSQPPNPR